MVNFEDWKMCDDEIGQRIDALNAEKQRLKLQRAELKADYLQRNGLPIGTAVIPNKGRLKGERCHIYEVGLHPESGNIYYDIRKAKKDGTAANSGRADWLMKSKDLEVVRG